MKQHVLTLRAGDAAQMVKPLDVILMYGVPTLVGFSLWKWGPQLHDVGLAVEATTFMSALLFGLMFTSADLATRSEVGGAAAQRRIRMVKAAYHNVSYAFLVSLLLLGIAVVLGTVSEPETPVGTWATGALGGLGLHLVLTLLMVVNRLYTVLSVDHDNHATLDA